MIEDLDRSLEKLLMRELPLKGVEISFATPDDQFPSSSVKLPAIDLFLYDIRENTELRSNAWLEERRGTTFTRILPPARIDCSYLVTAWASEDSPTQAQDEHQLLGEVIKVMLRFKTLPEEILQGSLKEQTPPLPTVALQPGRLQSLGEFWQALGGKPKAAFDYTVTMSMQVHAAKETGIVSEMILDVQDMEKRKLEAKEMKIKRKYKTLT